jgi:hypothetical protein
MNLSPARVLYPVLFFAVLMVMVLVACSSGIYDDQHEFQDSSIPNSEGGALLIEATRAAQRAVSERKTATIQAITVIAADTEQASVRNATGTVQAVWLYQQQRDARATEQAQEIQNAQTLQAATDTAVAHSSQATGTAEAQQIEIAGTRTAGAVQATETTYAATSTRSAQEIQAALEGHKATATAEALEMQRTRAQEDAARSERWADFFDTLLKLLLGLGGIAFLLMLIVQIARYLDAIALRQRLVETRSGTVLMVVTRGQASAQIIKSTPNLLDHDTDNFDDTQTAVLDNQAPDLLKITSSQGETFIAKTDPEHEAREAQRKLALRLLRESMRYYAAKGVDPRSETRVPSFRDLEWSSETWVRAVNALKPRVIAKQGRGGGTYCEAEYPTIMALYSAIGERRILLGVEANPRAALEATPSPTLEAVAA